MAKMTTFLVFPSPENIQMQHLWMDCYKFQSFSVFHLMFTIKMEGGVLWLCQKFIIFIMNFIIEDIIWSKNLITFAYCVAYKVSAIFIKWFGCYNILLFHFSFVGVYMSHIWNAASLCQVENHQWFFKGHQRPIKAFFSLFRPRLMGTYQIFTRLIMCL